MQIVIDIDSYVLEHCKRHVKEHYANNIEEAIANGTPLPKGHGKLGDLTKLYNEIDARNKGKNKGKYTAVLALITFADTIIEADKE